MKSAPSIAFDYRPSRGVLLAAALVCVGATLAALANGLPAMARIALAIVALATGAQAVWRHGAPRFHRILRRQSGWVLVDGSGREHAAILAAHARRGGLLMLDFRDDAGTRFRPLFACDNLDADTRRRLVLMLARADIAHVE